MAVLGRVMWGSWRYWGVLKMCYDFVGIEERFVGGDYTGIAERYGDLKHFQLGI
jgi:hypothetical protein